MQATQLVVATLVHLYLDLSGIYLAWGYKKEERQQFHKTSYTYNFSYLVHILQPSKFKSHYLTLVHEVAHEFIEIAFSMSRSGLHSKQNYMKIRHQTNFLDFSNLAFFKTHRLMETTGHPVYVTVSGYM